MPTPIRPQLRGVMMDGPNEGETFVLPQPLDADSHVLAWPPEVILASSTDDTSVLVHNRYVFHEYDDTRHQVRYRYVP